MILLKLERLNEIKLRVNMLNNGQKGLISLARQGFMKKSHSDKVGFGGLKFESSTHKGRPLKLCEHSNNS